MISIAAMHKNESLISERLPCSGLRRDRLDLRHRLRQPARGKVLIPVLADDQVVLNPHAPYDVPVRGQLIVVDPLAVPERREEVLVEVQPGLDRYDEADLEGDAQAEVLEQRIGRLALGQATDVVDVLQA